MDVLSKPVPIADLSAQTSFTVYDQPCLLRKIYVNETTNAYPITILDDVVGQCVIPASLTAGTFISFFDIKFNESLKCSINASSTGSVTFIIVPELGATSTVGDKLDGEFLVAGDFFIVSNTTDYVEP